VTRRFVPLAAMALFVMVALPASAQQHDAQPPMSGQDQSRQAGPMTSPGMGPGMMGGGMMGPGMGMGGAMGGTSCPMMGMMGGMTDPSGMGMMGGGQMDPKVMARMLQLRGEMLKVMGDSLVQRGKAMETGK
jgi:hypothetical protein